MIKKIIFILFVGIFTIDIDGTTRSGTWDIGADEYVSANVTYPSVSIKGSVNIKGAATLE